jgi:hypothetical protein
MTLRFRTWIILSAVFAGLATSYSVFADETVYDRLDGHGPSGKRVDVIEWDSNLEIHTYPRGTVSGLSAKLDDRTEGKKVMVIGYRFSKTMKPLIRRAILGIAFTGKVKAYVDPTEKEFDKMAITDHTLSAPWVEYKLDPAPAQWYPDGAEENNTDDTKAPSLSEIGRPFSQPSEANTRMQEWLKANRAPGSVPSFKSGRKDQSAVKSPSLELQAANQAL